MKEDTDKIENYLPHRFPFLHVDRIIDFDESKKTIKCIKNVTKNEMWVQGHFPDNPILPGALIIEALNQVGTILMLKMRGKTFEESADLFVVRFKNFKCIKPVIPGDQLEITVKLIMDNETTGLFEFNAEGYVDGELVASLERSLGYYKLENESSKYNNKKSV